MTDDLMRESPLDSAGQESAQLPRVERARGEWVPSRFNARTLLDDGSMIIWNAYTGAMNFFGPEHRSAIEALLSKRGFSGSPSGLAAYLQQRGYIVPRGSDEYRRFQALFGQQHYRADVLELILLASEDCNFRCIYCYEDFPRGTMLPRVRLGIKKLVEKRARHLRRLSVGWFGGEPLYGWKAIEDLAPFFLKIAEEHSIEYSSSMSTNGYLLTPDIAEKLLSWRILAYQITIDGPKQQHDKKRAARDGSGTFETIFSNLLALKARGERYRVTIRINFDRENLEQLGEFLALLRDEFASDDRFRVSFHPVGRWGGPNDEKLQTCGLDEAYASRAQLQIAASQKGFNVVGTLADSNLPGSGACYAARPYNLIIGADGKLMKCTVVLDKKDYNIVGWISEDGELFLDEDKYALWIEPAFEADAACKKCFALPVCQGISCPLERIEYGQRPCPPVKLNIKRELVTTLEVNKRKARPVKRDDSDGGRI